MLFLFSPNFPPFQKPRIKLEKQGNKTAELKREKGKKKQEEKTTEKRQCKKTGSPPDCPLSAVAFGCPVSVLFGIANGD